MHDPELLLVLEIVSIGFSIMSRLQSGHNFVGSLSELRLRSKYFSGCGARFDRNRQPWFNFVKLCIVTFKL